MPSSLVSAVVLHAGRSGFHTRIFEVLEFLWRGVRIIQRRRDMANEYPHADGGTDVFCVAGVQREGHFSFYFSCTRHGVITGHFVNVKTPLLPNGRRREIEDLTFNPFSVSVLQSQIRLSDASHVSLRLQLIVSIDAA
ncbi:hypothetical protein [Paraburkholderia sp. 2C]